MDRLLLCVTCTVALNVRQVNVIEISAVLLAGVITVYGLAVIDDLCIVEIHHPIPPQHLTHHLSQHSGHYKGNELILAKKAAIMIIFMQKRVNKFGQTSLALVGYLKTN